MGKTQKHISFDDRKLSEAQEIADREGREDYDVIREALASYLSEKETNKKVHQKVPGESVVRPQDEVLNLDFNEMWVENGSFENIKHSDVVRAIEDRGNYFTYFKFIYLDDRYVCKLVVPMSYGLLDQLKRRSERYRV